MIDTFAIELRNVTKIFNSQGDGDVHAVVNMTQEIHDGEFFSLLGPSGCGKTTTLRMIAGFETPTEGEILVLGQEMGDIPPYLRPVNTVFQNYTLFPHLTVFDNVAFGLEMEKVDKREIVRRVGEALEMVQLEEMGPRKPSQLSGGQQQRIALARALIKQPAVLLLDEPLGALDRKLRKAMQLELKHLQKDVGITFIYVTHDQDEALTMSDRIAVMNEGVVLQVGSPAEIYEEPANRIVADFIGESNFLEGIVGTLDDEEVIITIGEDISIRLRDDSLNLREGVTVTLMVRPEKGDLVHKNQPGLHHDGWPGRIEEVIYAGTNTRYIIRLQDAQSVAVQVPTIDRRAIANFEIGDEVYVHWSAGSVRVVE